MIYFNENKEAYAFEIDNPIAQLDEDTWQMFSKDNVGTSWDIINNEFVDLRETSDYQEMQEQKEKERIAMLKMTPRDFLLAITSMGIEWSAIKELMSQNPQVEIELNYCQYVYRGNHLLDTLCSNFGVTPEQLDELFKTKGE